MKKLFLLVLLLSFFQHKLNAQWVQMSNGMGTNNKVLDFTSIDSNIFAGTDSGVYVSTNSGLNWTQTSLTLYVICLASNGNSIFASTNIYGFWRSTNNGENWIQSGFGNKNIFSIITNGNNIYAGAGSQFYGGGVYLSTNDGMNWNQIGLENEMVSALVILNNIIFAGTELHGVFRSSNNGANWIQTSMTLEHCKSLAKLGNNIFVGINGTYNTSGVYLSTDYGSTWTQTSLINRYIISLTTNGSNIFAGGGDNSNSFGVYLSKNNGINWTQKNEGFNTIPYVHAFLITNNYIFAGTYDEQSVWRRSYSEIINVKNISTEIPSKFLLKQNFPNPFNPITKIQFDISKSSNVVLKIFDITGKEINTLVNEKLNAGTYETQWNADNYPSEVYFYRLETTDYIVTKKMILIK